MRAVQRPPSFTAAIHLLASDVPKFPSKFGVNAGLSAGDGKPYATDMNEAVLRRRAMLAIGMPAMMSRTLRRITL